MPSRSVTSSVVSMRRSPSLVRSPTGRPRLGSSEMVIRMIRILVPVPRKMQGVRRLGCRAVPAVAAGGSARALSPWAGRRRRGRANR